MGKAIEEQDKQAIIERNMGRFGAAGITGEAIGRLADIAQAHGLTAREAQYHISTALMAATGITDPIPSAAISELDWAVLEEMAGELPSGGNTYFVL